MVNMVTETLMSVAERIEDPNKNVDKSKVLFIKRAMSDTNDLTTERK